MNDQSVSLTPIALSDEERASALENASHVTPELIGELVAYEPPMMEAEESARLNFDRAERLMKALAVYRDQPIDCSTPPALEAAKQIRLRLVRLRTGSERLRLEGNEPFKQRIEANNVRQKKIEDFLLPIEQRYDDAIKAAERAARERKQEAERKAAEEAKVVTDAISAIRARGTVRAGSTAAEIAAAVIDLTSDVLDGDFFKDRYGEAVVAKEQAIFFLEQAHTAAEASEARDKLLKDQADEIARRDAAEKVRQAVETTRQVQEAKHEEIRRTIANIRGITAWAIKAKAADIREKIAELDTIRQADFHPFEREAMAAHAEVTDALPDLLAMAEQRERTQAERDERAADEKTAEENMNLIVTRCANLEAKIPPPTSRDAQSWAELLEQMPIGPALFPVREEEARKAKTAEILKLVALRDRLQALEEKAEAERVERDRIAADKAAAMARQNRTTRALAEQCMTMHAALLAVRADPDFLRLSDETRAAVQAPLDAIAKAQEGGAA